MVKYKLLYIDESKRWYLVYNSKDKRPHYVTSDHIVGDTRLDYNNISELVKKHGYFFDQCWGVNFRSEQNGQAFIDELDSILLMRKLTE